MLKARPILCLSIALLAFSLAVQALPATAQGSPSKKESKPTDSAVVKPAANDGRAAVDRLIQALGGAAKVNAVRTLRQTITMEQQGQRVVVDQSVAYPDKISVLRFSVFCSKAFYF